MKDLTANKMFKKNIVIFYIATIIFILDRLSKYYILVLARSVEKLDITITTFLNFNLVFNSGIAFGLLSVDETFYYNIITLIIIVITLIILIGGLTRLTDSGLSITSWELFTGTLPPLNNNDWIEYFNLYKKIPEYKEQNFNMTLNEFKIIFWWEWVHRQLGRLIGLVSLLPMLYNPEIKKVYKLGIIPHHIHYKKVIQNNKSNKDTIYS